MPPSAPNTITVKDSNLIAILSYLSILVFIPYFMAENNQFVKYHAKQGLILFIIEVAVSVLSMFLGFSMLGIINILMYLINLGLIVLSIIGIVNVIKGEMKPLPIIGTLIK